MQLTQYTPTHTHKHKKNTHSTSTNTTFATQVALLFSIIESTGTSVSWSAVKLPQGRTQKACMHMIAKMREATRASKEGGHGGGAAGAKTPVRRKAAAAASASATKKTSNEGGLAEDDEEGGESSGSSTPTPTKKKRKSPVKSKVVKFELGSEEDAGEGVEGVAARVKIEEE